MFLLLLPLLLSFAATQSGSSASIDSSAPISVISYKWSKSRRNVEKTEQGSQTPASAMIPANKNFARNARINDPAGVRDPNADTIDGRSAAIERSVQESRSTQPKSLEGFLYKVKIQNSTDKLVEIVFWEYRFTDPSDPKLMTRHQFLCGITLKGAKDKELEGFSFSGPAEVINVGSLAQKSDKIFQEKVVINRVEYADGTIWQRKDWNFAEVKYHYERVLREPWAPGMCKGL
jgi:hypothetical protein